MNLFFGWTVAGWVVALFWALRRPGLLESADFRVTPFGAVPQNKTNDQPH